MFAMVLTRRNHMRKWIVAVFAVVVILFTIELTSFRKSNSLSPAEWREWVLSSDNSIAATAEHHDDGSPLILPSATGRVLVTGGGGMIGKRVVRRLLRANIAVTVLDKIFYDDEVAALQSEFPRGDLKVILGDIRDPTDLATAMIDVKGVIHLAAVSRVLWCLENQPDCTDINVRGTQLVIDALKGGWFIQASSREVYGNLDTLPVTEDSPHKPANVYGTSKAQAEDVITEHIANATAEKSKTINAIMLRLSNVYGSAKDHPERLIPAIMRNAISNRPIQMVGGDQDLDMVFVEDVVDAISLAVTRLHAKTHGAWIASKGEVEVFNVGTNASTSAMTLIRKAMWLTNSSSPLRIIPGDDRFPSRYLGSTVKASTVLGYKARVSIDEGLHRLATEILEDTVNYLQKKAASEPFNCGQSKRYTIDDLLALDGCVGLFSTQLDKINTMFAHFIPADRNGRWNDTVKFQRQESPVLWKFSIKPSDYDGQNAVMQFTLTDPKKPLKFKIPQETGVDEFLTRIDPVTGFLHLRQLDGSPLTRRSKRGKRQLPDAGILDDVADAYNDEFAKQFTYNYRIAPVCCKNKTAPWPLFREDPMASIVLDTRIGRYELFNSSQITTMCNRFAAAEHYAKVRLETLKNAPKPIVLQEAELPTGRAPDWRMRKNADICSNVCDHPTFCIDTGDCTCTHAAGCAPRVRFPYGDFANMPILSYPPPKMEDGGAGDDALVKMVERSSWANMLSSDARRYMGRSPDWPAITAVRNPDWLESIKEVNATKFFSLKNSWMGCFSADTVMERGTKAISKEYKEGESLVFIPFYSINDFVTWPDPIKFIDHAANQLALKNEPEYADMIMTYTHDFGRCNNGELNVLQVRRMQYKGLPEKRARTTSWAPMGDLNSPCYYPDQDVVIPSRTCLQDDLRAAFSDISKVKPIRQRSVLATFKGRTFGIRAGKVIREKLMCERPVTPGRLDGGENLERWWGQLRPNSNYLQTINETVFCPLPRGTTGWATRTIDVIYGGCIPVLIGDQTHHPFWDVLDWSKFAIFIDEWDLQNLENILVSYSWEELERMQANLMLVRDAFLYPAEENMEKGVLEERSPFWFAMHSTWLLKQTKYPV